MQELFFRLGLPLVKFYKKTMFDLDIASHAPMPEGPKILVSNHPSTTDPFLILEVVPDPVHLLVDDHLFKVPLFGTYLQLSGHIRVIPENGRTAYQAALRKLRQGKSIVIYPEGAISPLQGGFHKPRTGAARLALQTGFPVIPVGISLDRSRIRLIETMVEGEPTLGTWYFRGPYAMTVGRPVTFLGNHKDPASVDSVSEQIMRHIFHLSRQSDRRLTNAAHEIAPTSRIRSLLKEISYG